MRVNGLECEERNRNDKAVKEQEIGWRVSGGGFFLFSHFFLPGALPPDGTCATNRSTSNLKTGRCRQFHKKKTKFIFSIAIGTSQWKTTWKWHYSQNSKKKKSWRIYFILVDIKHDSLFPKDTADKWANRINKRRRDFVPQIYAASRVVYRYDDSTWPREVIGYFEPWRG